MQELKKTYTSLDGEVERVSWGWKVTAFSSSWLIMLGFLTLYPFFDKNPEIRATVAVPAILASTFLSAGFGLAVVAFIVVKNPVFRMEAIFQPCFSSSSLALVSVFYNFAVSRRLTWNPPSLIYIALSTCATVVFGFLYLFAYLRDPKHHRQGKRSSGQTNYPLAKYPAVHVSPVHSSNGLGTPGPALYTEERREPIRNMFFSMPRASEGQYPPQDSPPDFHAGLSAPEQTLRRVGNSNIELPKHVMEYYDDNADSANPFEPETAYHGTRNWGSARNSRPSSREGLTREERRAQIEYGK